MNEKQIALKSNIDTLVNKIEAVQIGSQIQYDDASSFLKMIADTIKQVDAEFEEDRKAAKAAYDAVLEDKRQYKLPLEKVDQALRRKMSEYATAQEKIRQEALRKEKEEQALRQAEELASMGRIEAAEKVLAKPETVKLHNEPPKVGKLIEVWNVNVANLEQFLTTAIANGDMNWLEFVQVRLADMAKYCKEKGIKEFPGLKIEIVQRPSL